MEKKVLLIVLCLSILGTMELAAMSWETAVILTPAPGPAPRINGARVFGVRPGSPFLFRIPATGERPLTFSAENLPAGLTVDPLTGIITGIIRERGSYSVMLMASNSRGTASRELRVVCGDTLALTPHMGWNSWYVWENHVTDEIMRAAANAMVSSGMADHGYMYVNIDDCWPVKPGATDPTLQGEPRDQSGSDADLCHRIGHLEHVPGLVAAKLGPEGRQCADLH